MNINDVESLFYKNNAEDLWEDIIDETRELYLEKGRRYVIRIIGPVVKARRCFVSRDNEIIRRMTVDKFKNVIKGNNPFITSNKGNNPSIFRHQNNANYINDPVKEIEMISDKSTWSRCLISTVVLISNNGFLKNNILYYFIFSKTMIREMMNACSNNENICLSGVKANNICIEKQRHINTSVLLQNNFLPKEAIENILNNGLKNPKDFYLEANRRNLNKKCGFFYSFKDEKKNSILDKYMEPLTQIQNYIEEDKEYSYIENNPKIVNELEDVSLVGFNDVF